MRAQKGDKPVSKTNRFFEIIQMLRMSSRPVLAQDLADALEVSVRTIYRDIATLQARQTPIYGEAGVGYVMRKGYDLPSLNLDMEEAEAVAVGLSMIARTGDAGLWRAAVRAARKLHQVAPGTRQLVASSYGVEATPVDLGLVRRAIRDERKLRITYSDVNDHRTERVIWPIAMVYYMDAAMAVAWCELRCNLRHFRMDRMPTCVETEHHFAGQGAALLALWEATQKDETVSTRALGGS
ncbi:YafY family protein [Ascidiaceihabitans sp.]|uniref:helix-turn-helix transcriptional regulator n=1 Tax=Ascidiaceihabitans sp. TaxID=1872644 RepID=UPI0032995C7E